MKNSILISSLLMSLTGSLNFVAAADGDLDTTFDTDGKVTTNNLNTDQILDIAIQSDGKIIAVGRTGNVSDFMVARYDTDGSLDASFGTGGIVTTDIGSNSSDFARGVAIQSNGKIVVSGFSNSSGNNDFTVVRYNSNGSLDASFGTGGIVTTDIGSNSSDIARGVAIQSNGKIVLTGFSGGDFALVRYNSDGSLDTSFDTDGKVTASFSGTSTEESYSLAIQSDGKIVACGAILEGGVFDWGVMRFNSVGGLDNNFSGDGKVALDMGSSTNEFPWDLAIQSDGKIVVVGYTNNGTDDDFALARLTSSGNLDLSFGTGGKVTTQPSNFKDQANSVLIQNDGKIVAGGFAQVNGEDFALVRYNTDGSVDNTFGSSGIVTTNFGDFDGCNAVALQSDGKIVAGGDNSSDFALARYENTDTPLAVELTEFFAKAGDSQVRLSWETESEIENLGFELYRSSEKSEFKMIASYESHTELKGAGNSTQPHAYSFTDKTVKNGKTYTYKIADVDFYGIKTFHKEITATPLANELENEKLEKAFELSQNFPNPFNPTTTIDYALNSNFSGIAKLQIFNALGENIYEFSLTDYKGSVVWNGTDKAGKTVSSGTYFYQIKNSLGESLTRKMQLLK